MWDNPLKRQAALALRRGRSAIAPLCALWLCAIGCGNAVEPTPAPPCSADLHCVLDDLGRAGCEPGHTWAAPDDPRNLSCVPVAVEEDADVQGGDAQAPRVAGPRPFNCGDGKCTAPWETAANCTVDCAHWKPVCGDGSCDEGETCGDCSEDCGVCKVQDTGSGPKCGDYICAASESCNTCPTDCGNCTDGGGGGPGSCKGKCGKFDGAASCQCDNSCVQYGDCCADYSQYCP